MGFGLTLTPQTDHPGIRQPFILFDGAVRGRLVRLNSVAGTILARHGYPDAVSKTLAEAMAAGAALSDALKFDGSFTLQIQGDGPVHTIVTDITSDRAMRACAQFDEDTLPVSETSKDLSLHHLVGQGHIAFTVDQGVDSDRYQGIVELAGSSIAECIHQYFRQSEQLETAIKITSGRGSSGAEGEWQASAIMVQRMPAKDATNFTEDDEDAWRTAVILLSSITDDELSDGPLSEEDVLRRLFGTVGGRLLENHSLTIGCRCSRERSENILASFPIDEIRTMAVDGKVSMTCEFCNITFDFSEDELDLLERRVRNQ